jgi:hypothetical protein
MIMGMMTFGLSLSFATHLPRHLPRPWHPFAGLFVFKVRLKSLDGLISVQED